MDGQKLTSRPVISTSQGSDKIHVVRNGISYQQEARFFKPETLQNDVIGGVTYLGGMEYYVWASQYTINSVTYNTFVSDTVTLSDGGVDDRFDIFAIEINTLTTPAVASVVVIEGTENINPVFPSIDTQTQVKISFLLVGAGETDNPNVVINNIYDENVGLIGGEWDSISSPLGSNLDYNIDPYTGVKSYRNETLSSGTQVWKNDQDIVFYDTSKLVFAFKGDLSITSKITFLLKNSVSGSYWSKSVNSSNIYDYGFSDFDSGWQLLEIKLNQFSSNDPNNSVFDTLELKLTDTPVLDFDKIFIQSQLDGETLTVEDIVLNNVIELRSQSPTEKVYVLGGVVKNDGAAADWFWDENSTEADNTGTIIKVSNVDTGRWKRKYDGAVIDNWFGLVDDSGLTTDQTSIFQKMLSVGGEIELTENYTYYVPTLQNYSFNGETSIFCKNTNKKTKIVGDGTKDPFRPENSFKINNLHFHNFDKVFRGTNGVSFETFEVVNCKATNSDKFMGDGGYLVDNLIIENNHFESLLTGVVFGDNSVVNKKQSFSRNTIVNVGRYVYRLQSDAPLYFENNNIYDVNVGGATGSSGVARVIQFGSNTTNYIRGNTIDKVVSTDGNANLFYWSAGNAFVEDNTIGYFSDGGFIINEKGGVTKESIHLVNNRFISKELVSSEYPQTKTILNRYSSGDNDNNRQSTVVTGNYIKELKGSLVDLYNANDETYTEGAPKNAVIADNIIGIKSSPEALVNIRNGVSDVDIHDNIVRNWSTDGTDNGDGDEKRLVSIRSGVFTIRNINIHNNQVAFDNDGYDSFLLWSTVQDATGVAIVDEINITSNVSKNLSAYIKSRFHQGTGSYIVKNNINTGTLNEYMDGYSGFIANANNSLVVVGNNDSISDKKVINVELESGTWDMQATPSINVPHGLTVDERRTIIITGVTVRNDGNSTSYLNYPDLLVSTNLTDFVFNRVSGGFFDDANFNGNVNRVLLYYNYTKD
mgnify:CR=1 FL=1|tara:strand:- start:57 stop:3011 length:2955 start_codon:yes stop_codon:yes gene_type:complete